MAIKHGKQQVSELPHSIFYARWLREQEAGAARAAGISLYTLMQRAGESAFRLALRAYPLARRWLVLVGKGNNGGDGYVVARLARAAGIRVTLLACPATDALPPEATQARRDWLADGGEENDARDPWPADADLIIDGLLGSGLSAAPREPWAGLIVRANRYPAPVLALDTPSGLDAETGAAAGEVIQAEQTITFITLKPGLFTGQAKAWSGRVHHDDLGLTDWLAGQSAPIRRLSAGLLSEWLLPRRATAHKGDNGRLLVVGGDEGTAGAIRMAGEAALRSGAGLVRVLTHQQNIAPLLAARPELMVRELTTASMREGLEWADVLVIGPGMGQSDWGKNALRLAENCNKPMLWDADALNLLAITAGKRQNRVITPHPGEAARLLNCRVAEIESNRLLAAQNLVKRYGGVALLKGAGTVIADESGRMSIADVGNAGMATGGMGDVLSGIIGALLGQKLPLYEAACAGCVVHGATADELARRHGMRGMLATDLLPALSQFVNPEWIESDKTE
ncbi:bifunctional ADP-dependent NAD(P)H-hydrate dehydratase/NAD(P)H-hydrate epimerase [Affinibrenneria salicis]|uniref:Bifunctional NAD(P)H-hydrate repair enzyme n=1 Tax=Affinibrenneria salicis TaxID=2590031 RepID=A0A5J5FWF2_9GAMM|nr:bifunctional ADP-dependent NAD(P)H-hydrate dehydratase/NAD(P)H-hydrate epimerase [Affinibrenneria salicis]KAA8998207.1 bifunctional ADP-dependent NAD(P)H-hydrate dehydratase/NAD(P)H-hydrate epimerase [Affinibrenneria salicis]